MAGLLFDIAVIDWIVIGGVLLYLLHRYATSNFNHWKDMDVPYLKPLPFFGNSIKTITLIQPIEVGLKKIYDRLAPHPYGGFFDLKTPMLMIRDPDLLKQIMIKDFNHFQDRGLEYNDEVEPLSANLINVGGERWKNLRSKLSPAFTSGKLKQMFPLIIECSENFVNMLNNTIDKEGAVLECRSLISKYSCDVVGSCAFGINCNCINDQNSEFSRIGFMFSAPSYEYTLRRIFRFFFPRIADMLNMRDIPEEVTKFFLKLTKETLEYREKHDIIRRDFMELLKQLKNKGAIYDDSGKTDDKLESNNWNETVPPPPEMEKTREKADKVFDNALLSAQAFSFFIAGFETTAAAITFGLHELAINPDIQEKLREELKAMLKETDGKFLFENIMSLPYLEKVISETLRKYPTAGHTMRRVTKPYVLPDSKVRLNVGDFVVITMYAMHNDPMLYPDPSKFDPERFTKEQIAKRHPFTYMPFGMGPRSCIGMRFAILEMKLTFAKMLSHFKFETCEKTTHPIKLATKTIFMNVKNGDWLKVSKLKEPLV